MHKLFSWLRSLIRVRNTDIQVEILQQQIDELDKEFQAQHIYSLDLDSRIEALTNHIVSLSDQTVRLVENVVKMADSYEPVLRTLTKKDT